MSYECAFGVPGSLSWRAWKTGADGKDATVDFGIYGSVLIRTANPTQPHGFRDSPCYVDLLSKLAMMFGGTQTESGGAGMETFDMPVTSIPRFLREQ